MIRKIFSVLFLLFISFSTIHAQLIRGYGIKAGLTSANQTVNWADWITNTKARQGIDAGIFVEWLNIPFISILTEVHLIQKGSDVTTNFQITTVEFPNGIPISSIKNSDLSVKYYGYSTKINYLSIPILAKLRISEGLLVPYILAGPRFDFKLSDNISTNAGRSFINYKNNDIGGIFGVGAQLASIIPIHIGAELRYSPSFQYCFSEKYFSVKNSSLEFPLVLSY